MQLYIGNKNYSSWSLRAWLLMTQLGIEFTERAAAPRLRPTARPSRRRCSRSRRPARVPLLVDDGFAVWDSLAIAEYLAERFPEQGLWPRRPAPARPRRSLCAEMHSGFAALRSRCPMNIEAGDARGRRPRRARVARRHRRPGRIDAMWSEAAGRERRPVPVRRVRRGRCVLRAGVLAHRDLRLAASVPARGPTSSASCALPAMLEWREAALTEHDFLVEDEPYRTP